MERDLNRKTVKISGESGQGINSIGEILSRSIKENGYKIFGYREYPSLIKGGYSSFQIDFSKDVPETVLEDLHQNGFPYLEKIDKPEVKIHKQKDSPE